MPHAAGLYWEEHGPADAPPLILSSGLGGSGSYWAPNVAALAARYRVIRYDHRGTGRSDREIDGSLSVETMADDILRLMDAIGVPRATLIGHALGGHIALTVALAAPERVARVVVVNGWARLDPYTARCFDIRLALLNDSGPTTYLHAQPVFLFPAQWISDHDDALRIEAAAHLAHFPGIPMVRRRIAAVRAFDIADRLHDIAVPVLAIAADDDMLVPASCSDRLVAGISGARLVRMASGGHACNVTRADQFDAVLLDWLGSE